MTKAEVKRKARERWLGCNVSHVFPRAYCIARERGWAVFAVPTIDREPQVKGDRFITIHWELPDELKTGDWAALAYIYDSNRQRGGMDLIQIL